MRNNLEHFGDDALAPFNTGFIFLFSESEFITNITKKTDGGIFSNFSGYGHKKELARLFHAWLDCFVLLRLGAVEVCILGVRLVFIYFSMIYDLSNIACQLVRKEYSYHCYYLAMDIYTVTEILLIVVVYGQERY